ncbi:MAG: pirin family protein [Taibaiella sp.]|nr:pirin family protein [Taibaiella sp.]
MNNTISYPANRRGNADHGWLKAKHSFSFAGYNDPSKIHFGVLRVLNDDIVAGGMGFGKHPHDNMEIITIILDGALEHSDNMGHKEAIQTGEVQVMSAGTGVSHSEYNHNKDKDVNLFQIWLFPNKRNVEPRYDQRMFDPLERINKLQTLVSPIDKNDEGLKIHQDAWIYRTQMDTAKSQTIKPHSAKNGFYVMVINGSIGIVGQTLNRRDAIGIWEQEQITITANENSDVLILEVPMEI